MNANAFSISTPRKVRYYLETGKLFAVKEECVWGRGEEGVMTTIFLVWKQMKAPVFFPRACARDDTIHHGGSGID